MRGIAPAAARFAAKRLGVEQHQRLARERCAGGESAYYAFHAKR
jgi:hypothetical protein